MTLIPVGTVLSVKPFGAFVSFGAEVDGLLHISELGKVVFEIEVPTVCVISFRLHTAAHRFPFFCSIC